MDGSSTDEGAGARIVLINPEDQKIHCALRFGFKASNNKAEYEAILAGLRLAKKMKVDSIEVSCDSQLVVCQVNEEYDARGEKMVAYLNKVKELIKEFSHFVIHQVPRAENSQVDALARLASTRDAGLLKVVPVEYLAEPSITYHEVNVVMPSRRNLLGCTQFCNT